MNGTELAEAGLIPDFVIRQGIRRMLRDRLRQIAQPDCEASLEAHSAFAESLRRGPIALVPELANAQHYEVTPAFFERALGSRLKYSCAWWPEGVADLDAAEEAMLELTCQRADIRDGMSVLDLGCGWGSLSLWIAQTRPHCRVLAVSNSKLQREFILDRCERDGLGNVEVVTADVARFHPDRRFDRVVSVEMFEHLRNYEEILCRIATWLRSGGALFVHVFCHREHAYLYESDGDNWMGRHFFSGGIMPSDRLLSGFQRDMILERQWRVDGRHYQKTCEAWLENLDAQGRDILPILAETYGRDEAPLWLRRWRLFFLGCSELFGYRKGQEWWVAHHRFVLPGESRR